MFVKPMNSRERQRADEVAKDQNGGNEVAEEEEEVLRSRMFLQIWLFATDGWQHWGKIVEITLKVNIRSTNEPILTRQRRKKNLWKKKEKKIRKNEKSNSSEYNTSIYIYGTSFNRNLGFKSGCNLLKKHYVKSVCEEICL